MTRVGHNFPPPDALPIPQDVRPGAGWTEQMREMADHIGAYATLLIVDRFGGQYVYVAADPERNRFRDLVGAAAAETLSHIYGRETLKIPTAKYALARARRHGVIAQCRANEISANEAAAMLKTSRTYFAQLLNQSDEGTEEGLEDARRGGRLPGQMDLFGEDE